MLCKHVYLRQILRLQTIRNVSVSYSKKASEPDKDNSKYLGRRKVDLWREYESVKQKVSGNFFLDSSLTFKKLCAFKNKFILKTTY